MVMDNFVGNGYYDTVLHKTFCISYSSDSFEKDNHPTIIPLAMGKLLVRLGSLTFVWKPVKEKDCY